MNVFLQTPPFTTTISSSSASARPLLTPQQRNASLLPAHLTTFASPTILKDADVLISRVATVTAAAAGDHIFIKPPTAAAPADGLLPGQPRERRLSAPNTAAAATGGNGSERMEVARPKSLPLNGPHSIKKVRIILLRFPSQGVSAYFITIIIYIGSHFT